MELGQEIHLYEFEHFKYQENISIRWKSDGEIRVGSTEYDMYLTKGDEDTLLTKYNIKQIFYETLLEEQQYKSQQKIQKKEKCISYDLNSDAIKYNKYIERANSKMHCHRDEIQTILKGTEYLCVKCNTPIKCICSTQEIKDREIMEDNVSNGLVIIRCKHCSQPFETINLFTLVDYDSEGGSESEYTELYYIIRNQLAKLRKYFIFKKYVQEDIFYKILVEEIYNNFIDRKYPINETNCLCFLLAYLIQAQKDKNLHGIKFDAKTKALLPSALYEQFEEYLSENIFTVTLSDKEKIIPDEILIDPKNVVNYVFAFKERIYDHHPKKQDLQDIGTSQLFIKLEKKKVKKTESENVDVYNISEFGKEQLCNKMCIFVKSPFIPEKHTYGSAGSDIHSNESCVIKSWERKVVSTNLSVNIPDGHYIKIYSRSGLASKHCIDVGAGVIDADFKNEIKVLLINNSGNDYTVNIGDRIAEMILYKIPFTEFVNHKHENLEPKFIRFGGFGITNYIGNMIDIRYELLSIIIEYLAIFETDLSICFIGVIVEIAQLNKMYRFNMIQLLEFSNWLKEPKKHLNIFSVNHKKEPGTLILKKLFEVPRMYNVSHIKINTCGFIDLERIVSQEQQTLVFDKFDIIFKELKFYQNYRNQEAKVEGKDLEVYGFEKLNGYIYETLKKKELKQKETKLLEELSKFTVSRINIKYLVVNDIDVKNAEILLKVFSAFDCKIRLGFKAVEKFSEEEFEKIKQDTNFMWRKQGEYLINYNNGRTYYYRNTIYNHNFREYNILTCLSNGIELECASDGYYPREYIYVLIKEEKPDHYTLFKKEQSEEYYGNRFEEHEHKFRITISSSDIEIVEYIDGKISSEYIVIMHFDKLFHILRKPICYYLNLEHMLSPFTKKLRTWYPNGVPKSIQSFSKIGEREMRHGKQTYYNKYGETKSKIMYKFDEKHGKCLKITNGISKRTMYKMGVLQRFPQGWFFDDLDDMGDREWFNIN